MSSTNKTANYELSQYIGSDKPTYLVDYNGDMLKIDTGMAANKAQADATDLVVAGHTSTISGIQGTVSDQGTAITGLRTDVDGNTGSINTINSLIGNGEPTTTDKTIIGAINELNSDIGDIHTEIAGYKVATLSKAVSVTADGVKTKSQILGDLYTALLAAANALPDGTVIVPRDVRLAGTHGILGTFPLRNNITTFELRSLLAVFSAGGLTFDLAVVSTNPKVERAVVEASGNTITDESSDVVSSGTVCAITYDEYVLMT